MCNMVTGMPNITISINEELLKKSREYSREHRTTLNKLIRDLLIKTVEGSSDQWLDECFSLMDKAKGDSQGKKWKRQDLYDV